MITVHFLIFTKYRHCTIPSNAIFPAIATDLCKITFFRWILHINLRLIYTKLVVFERIFMNYYDSLLKRDGAGPLIYQISANHYPLSLVRLVRRALKGVYNFTISRFYTGIRKNPKRKK